MVGIRIYGPLYIITSKGSLFVDDIMFPDDTGPVGSFHLQLALTCGFMYLAAGLQNNLNAYILSSVRCDLQVTSSQLGLLNAVFLIGELKLIIWP